MDDAFKTSWYDYENLTTTPTKQEMLDIMATTTLTTTCVGKGGINYRFVLLTSCAVLCFIIKSM